MSFVLGIETSCDECSASIVERTHAHLKVRSVATFSQIAIHRPYGGVVPEIASRNHLETINSVMDQALKDAGVQMGQIDAIAVTNRPGLAGALLVGVSAAKAIAYALGKPLVPVHHLEGHVASLFLDRQLPDPSMLPLCVALVSGGHTNLYVMRAWPELWPLDFLKRSQVGRSRDDAAGEAFDKTAKLMGFPYPGGAYIDQQAKKGGNPAAFAFPRALPQRSVLDFSFSGLKTAVALQIEELKKTGQLESRLSDLCASVQEAIIDALLSKMELAAHQYRCGGLAVVGGVAANSRLRSKLEQLCQQMNFDAPLFPELKYCSDNGAMIAAAGTFRLAQGHSLRGEPLMLLGAVPNPEV